LKASFFEGDGSKLTGITINSSAINDQVAINHGGTGAATAAEAL